MDKANTRSGARIQEARDHRDLHMQTYLHARTAMIALGVLSDADGAQSLFPPLSLADTFMKSTQRMRELGDSKCHEGLLWTMGGGVASGSAIIGSPSIALEAATDMTTAERVNSMKLEFLLMF